MTAPKWQEHHIKHIETLRKNITSETRGHSKTPASAVIHRLPLSCNRTVLNCRQLVEVCPVYYMIRHSFLVLSLVCQQDSETISEFI